MKKNINLNDSFYSETPAEIAMSLERATEVSHEYLLNELERSKYQESTALNLDKKINYAVTST